MMKNMRSWTKAAIRFGLCAVAGWGLLEFEHYVNNRDMQEFVFQYTLFVVLALGLFNVSLLFKLLRRRGCDTPQDRQIFAAMQHNALQLIGETGIVALLACLSMALASTVVALSPVDWSNTQFVLASPWPFFWSTAGAVLGRACLLYSIWITCKTLGASIRTLRPE